MLSHGFLDISCLLLLLSPCNRWGNWGKWRLSRFFKITKLKIILCNLTAELMFLTTSSLAKQTSQLHKGQCTSYVKCSGNICSRLKLRKQYSLAYLHVLTMWSSNSQRIYGKPSYKPYLGKWSPFPIYFHLLTWLPEADCQSPYPPVQVALTVIKIVSPQVPFLFPFYLILGFFPENLLIFKSMHSTENNYKSSQETAVLFSQSTSCVCTLMYTILLW